MWISFAAIAVLLLGGLVGWGVWRSQRPKTYAVPAGVTDNGAESGGTKDGGILVAGEGSVKVEVYLDFICPACKQFETAITPTLDQLLAEKKIKLVWHALSFLDDKSSPSGYSTRAASSVGCASNEGKLKPYGEALFAQQPPEGGPGLTDDQLIEIAGNIGIIAPSFAQCVRDVRYRDWTAQVSALAARRGVSQTPTIYIGAKLVAKTSPENIVAAVAAG